MKTETPNGGFKESTLMEQTEGGVGSTQEATDLRIEDVEEAKEIKVEWDRVLKSSRKQSALTYIIEEEPHECGSL